MPYLFTCPHCATSTKVDDQYSASSGQCLACGGEIKLPDFVNAEANTGAQTFDDQVSFRTVSRWLIGCVVAMVFFLVCYQIAPVFVTKIGSFGSGKKVLASTKNLGKIALALNAYCTDFGTYPPSVTRNSQGEAMHSWRVLLLPYLGEQDLYSRYRLDLPWSDAINRGVAEEMPTCYSATTRSFYERNYLSDYYLVTGPSTLQPKSGPIGFNAVSDEVSQTVLVVEGRPTVASGLWIEPIDFIITEMIGDIRSIPGTIREGSEIGGVSPNGVVVATVDNRVHFISETTEPFYVKGMLTATGDEPLPKDLP